MGGKYDFMIALFGLRYLMGIPILLIKTKLDSKGGRYKPRNFSCKYWYPCKSDAKLSKSEFLMFASNGFDVVVPCLPTPIAELKKTVDIFKDNMKEGLELCHDILEMTPNSPLKSAFKTIEYSLLTAKTLCQGTVLTTGAADLTGIASQPVIMPVGHHQGMCLHQPPSVPATEEDTQSQTSQKRHHEGDGDYISPTKRRVFTPLKQFECHCGLELLNHDALEVHMKGSHANNVWKCSVGNCEKVYNTPASVRLHFRNKHSKEFRHYCNVGECEYGHDEISFVKKHKHQEHGIASDIVCPKCDHVFSQKNKLLQHIKTCQSEEKPYGCSEESCTKRYRAKRSLDKHMANVHPEPGQDIPRKNCNVPGCGATFVWADSLRLHTKNKHPGMKHLMLPINISEAFYISIIPILHLILVSEAFLILL